MARDPDAPAITSHANPTLQRVRALLQRPDRRREERAFVVEGRRAVADALAAGAVPDLVLLRDDPAGRDAELALVLPPGVPVRRVAPALFGQLTEVVTPQGLLAVFPFPTVPAPPGVPLLLVVDAVRDPGNLGTLLRTAAGAGATGVLLAPGTVDPFNPKVVRAAVGAHFRVPVAPLDDAARAALRDLPLRAVARADAAEPYDAIDWRQPAALIVGAEAAGISDEVAALGTTGAAIPLAAGVESLNAAVAGAVLLFEAARQRRSRKSESREVVETRGDWVVG